MSGIARTLYTITTLGALTLMSACGSDSDALQSFNAAKSLATSVTSSETAEPFRPTRAELAAIPIPVDLVTVAKNDAVGVIFKIANNGPVETWSSADNKTISMRDGIIVATRGFGADLMSAQVPAPRELASNHGNSHKRLHVWLESEEQPTNYSFTCTMSDLGQETIVVVERSYSTRHMREICDGAKGSFSNDYWFQNSGKLRQSRQWISQNVEYVFIQHLAN